MSHAQEKETVFISQSLIDKVLNAPSYNVYEKDWVCFPPHSFTDSDVGNYKGLWVNCSKFAQMVRDYCRRNGIRIPPIFCLPSDSEYSNAEMQQYFEMGWYGGSWIYDGAVAHYKNEFEPKFEQEREERKQLSDATTLRRKAERRAEKWAHITQSDVDDAVDVLRWIPASCEYPEWYRILHGVQYKLGPVVGLLVAKNWSSSSPEKYDAYTLEQIWKSYNADRPDKITWGTVIHIARQYGCRDGVR